MKVILEVFKNKNQPFKIIDHTCFLYEKMMFENRNQKSSIGK